MSARAATIRANVKAILSAAVTRSKGRREWPAVYPDTSNRVKAYAGRDSFGCPAAGAFVLWWSEFRTLDGSQGTEEVRRGLFSPPCTKLRLKGEAHNLITQAITIRERLGHGL